MILLLGVQVQDTIRNRGIICKMIAMRESVKENYDQGTTCKEADIQKNTRAHHTKWFQCAKVLRRLTIKAQRAGAWNSGAIERRPGDSRAIHTSAVGRHRVLVRRANTSKSGNTTLYGNHC